MGTRKIGEVAKWRYKPLKEFENTKLFEVEVLTGEEFGMIFYELEHKKKPVERNSNYKLIFKSYINLIAV